MPNGYDEYPMYYGSEGYGAALPDTAADTTSDPYAAPPEGDYPDAESYREAAEDPNVDIPDVDATGGGLPGANLSGFLPDSLGGRSFADLARTFKLQGPGGALAPRMEYSDDGGNGYTVQGSSNTAAMRSQLMKAASNKIGFRLTWKKLAYMLTRFGMAFTAKATGMSASALLFLWMSRPHKGRRGPFFRTVVKRIRRGRRYEAMMRHWASKAHVHRGGFRHAGGYRRRARRR